MHSNMQEDVILVAADMVWIRRYDLGLRHLRGGELLLSTGLVEEP